MNQPQLRDIHLPETSLWWPPAPGWWLLLGLLLILALLIPWLRRRLRQRSVKQLSMLELRRIREEYQAGGNNTVILGELAALLRRTVIAYHGRQGFAASTGDAWIEQLSELALQAEFSQQQLALLSHERYRRNYPVNIEQLLMACERWLEALPRRLADVAS